MGKKTEHKCQALIAIETTRREKLKSLTNSDRYKKVKSAVASDLSIQAAQFSGYLKAPGEKGHRVIGEGSARQWEAVLGLPILWFDGFEMMESPKVVASKSDKLSVKNTRECCTPEECELLDLYRLTAPDHRSLIAEQARLVSNLYPLPSNVHKLTPNRSGKSRKK